MDEMDDMIEQETGGNTDNIDNTDIIDDIDNTESAEVVETAEDIAVAAKPGRNLRKERTGIVVSNKMDKTIVVKVEESVKHSKYSKILKRSVKFKAHDEKNECDVGDKVLIMETRPISRDKHFRLVRIIEKVK